LSYNNVRSHSTTVWLIKNENQTKTVYALGQPTGLSRKFPEIWSKIYKKVILVLPNYHAEHFGKNNQSEKQALQRIIKLTKF
jgi:hypothetical protein